MNYEQLAYLKTIVPCADEALFAEFERTVDLHAMIKAFEARVHAAWDAFMREHRAARPPTAPAQQYSKLVLQDFGNTAPAQPANLQKQKLPCALSKTAAVQPSHSSQALAAALASTTTPPAPRQLPAAGDADATPATPAGAGSPPPDAAPPPGSPAASGAAPSSALKPPAAPEPTKPPPPPCPVIRFSVRNARQNEPYDEQIQRSPDLPGLRLLDVTLPAGAALKADLANWRITGTPSIAGEFTLGLRYALADQPADISHTAGMPFVINADPKTLWQDKPSDRAAPFWKEDSATGIILGQHARMIAARKRGRSHAHKGTCCDDDFHLHYDAANGWYLGVVADGAGSARFSRRGSQVATRAVGSYLKEVFADERGSQLIEAIEAFARCGDQTTSAGTAAVLQQRTRNELFKTVGYAAHHAVRELQTEAKNRSDIITSPKELSTTLLIGLARKLGDKWFCAAYWVGDGAVAVYRRNQSVHLLGAPDSGEFSGQTHFLDASQVSQEALIRRLRFEVVEDMTALLLMTDGVSDPKFRSEAAMAELQEWDRLWDDLDAGVRLSSDNDGHETRLLEWLDFWAQGEYDDRTIAIIY